MKIYVYFLVLSIGLFGCSQTEIKIPEKGKKAESFSEQFLSYIIDGQIEKSFEMVAPEALNEQAKEFITNASLNINHETVRQIKPVEYVSNITVFKGETVKNYKISYEYSFDKGYVLFLTTLQEKDNRLMITGFDGKFLQAPLSELTKFSLQEKTVAHYLILLFSITIPIFILITFIVMLSSKISIKKKIIWGLIILVVSFPRLFIDWNSGEVGFNLLNLRLLGGGFSRANLYSAWILSFNVPIGAILFWFKRQQMLNSFNKTQAKTETENM